MARNKYKVEIWQYHDVLESQTFTSRKKACEYAKQWYWTYEYGDCCIEIYENGVRLDRFWEFKGLNWK